MNSIAHAIPSFSSSGQTGNLLASPRHTTIFVGIVFALATMGAINAASSPATEATPAMSTVLGAYVFMIFAQLMWLQFIRKGMRAKGSSVLSFLGDAWGPASIAADLACAAALCALVFAVSAGVAKLLPAAQPHLSGFMPQGVLGHILWLCMAAAAGVCEEVAFRGYFQRQLAALSGKPWIAIAGQALLFGVAHSYQGFAATGMIVFVGLMLGLLAAWRGNIRACILAHAATDILAGVLGY